MSNDRIVQAESWAIEQVGDELAIEFVQVLLTDEEEPAILEAHPDDDPHDHAESKKVRLVVCDEDLDDLARVLAAWRALDP